MVLMLLENGSMQDINNKTRVSSLNCQTTCWILVFKWRGNFIF